jgi:hypothetical protein
MTENVFSFAWFKVRAMDRSVFDGAIRFTPAGCAARF